MLVFGSHVGNTASANIVARKPSTAQGNHTGRLGHRDAPQRTCPLLKKHLKVGGDATLSIGVDLRVRKLGCGVQPPLARV